MSAAKRVARETLLWVGGVLGALCLLSLLAGWLFQVTPLVFSSGSMSPAYAAGALGIAHEVPASDLAVGDVVSVLDAQGQRVTHRITGLDADGGAAVLTLRGDANEVADAHPYVVETADRVVLGVPYAGYVLNAAASPFGLVAAALLVLALLLIGFGRGHRLVPVGLASTVALGVGLGASGVTPWAFTSAYWTDTADATVRATTPAPGSHQQPVCTSNEGSGQNKAEAKLTWTGLGPQYEFHWELWKGTSPGGSLYSSGTLNPVNPPTSVTLMFGIVSGGGGNDSYYAKVWTRLVSDHSNVGSPTTTLLHSGPRPNGPNWWMYCGQG
ncbi:signal peptidase I [Nocardioides carbamazepini]|jgi:signal peptidase I|uniref:signal peptidase I n=1 Tax=Nocardioides carbamazepini TaxID=2854259 RepID=UPI002149EA41|nr:signal peptidase I [Nocardioides carbamazepini]MCR1783094.1 signal peptidase I [Nocardioides carbamazepini]